MVSDPADTTTRGTAGPPLQARDTWREVVGAAEASGLLRLLMGYLVDRRWFRSKARERADLRLVDHVPVELEGCDTELLLLEMHYVEGAPELYVLPLSFASGALAEQLREEQPHLIAGFLRLEGDGQSDPTDGVLYDAVGSEGFDLALLDIMAEGRELSGACGRIRGVGYDLLRGLRQEDRELEPRVGTAEQTNTSIIYGGALILKLFRTLEEGESPDLELNRFLSRRAQFANVPPLAGSLRYRVAEGQEATLGILQGFITSQGDAWEMTIRSLGGYLDGALIQQRAGITPPPAQAAVLERLDVRPPDVIKKLLGEYWKLAGLLGRRTAEMHLALSSDHDDPAVAPEPLAADYEQSLKAAAARRLQSTFNLLRDRQSLLPPEAGELVATVLGQEGTLSERLRRGIGGGALPSGSGVPEGARIRCHGDYHLGQILFTGDDFVIIDFEGEPARSLAERRAKESPLKDVAGMLRSFHYAAIFALRQQPLEAEDRDALASWANAWQGWIATAYTSSYLSTAQGASFLPTHQAELETQLNFFLLDKCIYELGYELNNRPDWVVVPLKGLIDIIGESP